jgi:hypothetical protein
VLVREEVDDGVLAKKEGVECFVDCHRRLSVLCCSNVRLEVWTLSFHFDPLPQLRFTECTSGE